MFKIKRSGVYLAGLVVLGYSQIPGVDYTDNFAPVVNDVTFRLMLSQKLIEKLKTHISDVETAFLYGDWDGEIYMEGTSNNNQRHTLKHKRMAWGIGPSW